jgi:hypothetical protein
LVEGDKCGYGIPSKQLGGHEVSATDRGSSNTGETCNGEDGEGKEGLGDLNHVEKLEKSFVEWFGRVVKKESASREAKTNEDETKKCY